MYSDFINMTFLNMVVKIMKHIKLKFKITESFITESFEQYCFFSCSNVVMI